MWFTVKPAPGSFIRRLGSKATKIRRAICLVAATAIAYTGVSQVARPDADAAESLKLEIQVVGGFGGECLGAGKSGVCLFTIKGTKQLNLPTLCPYGKGRSERTAPCPPYVRDQLSDYDQYQAARVSYEFVDGANTIASSAVVCLDGERVKVGAKPEEIHAIPVKAPKAPGRYKFSVTFDNTNVKDASWSYNFVDFESVFTRIASERVEVTIE